MGANIRDKLNVVLGDGNIAPTDIPKLAVWYAFQEKHRFRCIPAKSCTDADHRNDQHVGVHGCVKCSDPP